MTLGAVIGVLVNVVFYAILSYRLAKRSVILDEREQAIEELLSKAESTMELVEEIIDMSRAEILEANKLTVSEMMEKRGGQEEYDLFVGLVSEIVREKYETFRFLRQDPSPDDFESGNCLIFQIHREEYPEVYETLFRLAIIHHLEEGEITKAFTRAVKDNAVIPIGEVEIQDIGTGISSVTQGHDIRALITFKTPEYIAEGEKVKEKAEKESKKKAMEDKKLGSIRGEAVRAVNKGTAVINEMMTTLNDVDPDNAKATRNAMAHVQDIVKEAYGKTFS